MGMMNNGGKEIISLLVKDIKKKKELATLDDAFVEERVQALLHSYPKLSKVLASPADKVERSREFNTVVKEVRKRLRESYGVFIMKEFSQKKPSDPDEKILASHRSSFERLHSYGMLYRKVLASLDAVIKEKQASEARLKVVDLGSGMNPASYAVLQDVVKLHNMKTPVRYDAYDISSQDVSFLNQYFRERGIDGKARQIDLTKESEFSKIDLAKKEGETLVCFLFKLLDTLESVERHISKKLIAYLVKQGVDALVITFPQKTIGGGRRISEEKRWWLEGFLQREHLKFEKFPCGDEMVYIVRRT
jgi:hypothetical protein